MYDNPKHWSSHYHNQTELELGYSLLDRVRYYYGNENIIQSINRLKANINSIEIPDAIVSQHLPKCYNYYRENKSLSFDEIIYCHIEDVLDNYQYATKQ
jgi:D-tagatose-1,6-bisphosphate aldolase subunit GatZ/KbaZ